VSAAGALLGVVVAVGLACVARGSATARRPSLEALVVPYLRDVSPSARAACPWPAGGVPGPHASRWGGLLTAAARRLDQVVGGQATLARRLEQRGYGTVERHREEQVLCAGAAMAATLALFLLRTAAGDPVPAPTVTLLVATAGVGGIVGRDRWLTRQLLSRRRRLIAEFPTVAELVALSVAAGEGVVGAVDRVARATRGELAGELARCLDEVRRGTPVAESLQDMARRLDVVPLHRFVEGLVVALQRGTPLGPVLRAQAADARASSRRELVESAARREVAMMLPVVFLVLPTSVAFALFPGFYGLSLVA
jgi:tight adherence protein C